MLQGSGKIEARLKRILEKKKSLLRVLHYNTFDRKVCFGTVGVLQESVGQQGVLQQSGKKGERLKKI